MSNNPLIEHFLKENLTKMRELCEEGKYPDLVGSYAQMIDEMYTKAQEEENFDYSFLSPKEYKLLETTVIFYRNGQGNHTETTIGNSIMSVYNLS